MRYLLILVALLGCVFKSSSDSEGDLLNNLGSSIAFAKRIEIGPFFKEGKTPPLRTWQPVIEFLNNDKWGCLVFHESKDLSESKLKYIETSKSCSEIDFQDGHDLSIEKISGVSIVLNGHELELNYVYAGKNKKNKFKIFNINNEFAKIVKTDAPTLLKLNTRFTDSYRDQNLCFGYDDKCNVIKNECGRCRFGAYEVVMGECFGKLSMLCGPNRCGSLGEPACLRGENYGPRKISRGCRDGAISAICLPPLKVKCDQRGVAICSNSVD